MAEQDYYWKEGAVSGGVVTPDEFKTTIFTRELSPTKSVKEYTPLINS
jgi:hypothetical protein